MTERKWKPGDKFALHRPSGAPLTEATILRVVRLAGVREFALHESPNSSAYVVSHIGTGNFVAYGDTKAQAVVRAARRVSAKGGAAAIRAAVERHK